MTKVLELCCGTKSFGKVFTENCNKIVPHLLEFYKKLIKDYSAPSLAPIEGYQEIVKEVTEEINSAPSDSDEPLKRDDQGEITSPVANQQ